jgi:hypothetical protein
MIVIIGAFTALGFTGGFYLATALQKQIEALIGAAIVLGFLTWLGSGTDFLRLVREWYKDKREEEMAPKLEFRSFVTNAIESSYYVRIKNVKERVATECQGYLTIEGTEVTHIPSTWKENVEPTITISEQSDLFLFYKLVDQLFFGKYGSTGPMKKLGELGDKSLLISINWGENNKNQLEVKIKEIINMAIVEK